ncbi:hypothetical protein [Lacticaseibacillus jixiensis]|uniref:hypothetical protein n=1 Tax=Lacticaseibacillus jixiensis TaxID=3231926 RepID=UPI0036F408D5
MVKSEWYKYSRRMVVWIFICAITVIAIQDAIASRSNFIQLPYIEAKFLLASTNKGHMAAITLLWLLPIYYFVTVSELYLNEKRYHIDLLLVSRSGRSRFLKTKMLFGPVFISGSYFIVFLLNAGITSLLCKTQNVKMVESMIEVFPSWRNMAHWIYDHRLLTYLLYVLMTTIIIFTFGVLINAIVISIPNRKLCYPILLVYWQLWWFGKYDISKAMQPFTEYGLSYAIVSFSAFVLSAIVIIVILWKRLAADDIT